MGWQFHIIIEARPAHVHIVFLHTKYIKIDLEKQREKKMKKPVSAWKAMVEFTSS